MQHSSIYCQQYGFVFVRSLFLKVSNKIFPGHGRHIWSLKNRIFQETFAVTSDPGILNLCNTKRTVKRSEWLVARQSHMGPVSKNYLIASSLVFTWISWILKGKKVGKTLESLRSGSDESKWEIFGEILEREVGSPTSLCQQWNFVITNTQRVLLARRFPQQVYKSRVTFTEYLIFHFI